MQDNKKQQPLTIDDSLCIQCGTCIATYPDLFEFYENGTKVRVKKDADFSGQDLEEIIAVCPSLAIIHQSKGKGKKETQKKLSAPKKKK